MIHLQLGSAIEIREESVTVYARRREPRTFDRATVEAEPFAWCGEDWAGVRFRDPSAPGWEDVTVYTLADAERLASIVTERSK